MIARKRVEVFKPTIDNRYSDNEIVPHRDLRMNSQVVSNATEITKRIDWRSEVVGIGCANAILTCLTRSRAFRSVRA